MSAETGGPELRVKWTARIIKHTEHYLLEVFTPGTVQCAIDRSDISETHQVGVEQ